MYVINIDFNFDQYNEFSVPIYCNNMKILVHHLKSNTSYKNIVLRQDGVVLVRFGDCVIGIRVPDKTDLNDCDLDKLMKKIVQYHIRGIPDCPVCLESCTDMPITVCSKCYNTVCLFCIQKIETCCYCRTSFEKKYNDDVMHSLFTDDEIAEMNEDCLLVVH